jgi:hypothetical protein
MHSPSSRRRTGGQRCELHLTALLAATVALAAGCSSASSAGTTPPNVEINGSSTVSTLHDGQTITVSLGPNKIYKPLLQVNIIECADPGGTSNNLPMKLLYCDENTIQANSVIVKPDGRVNEFGYTVFRLPNAQLGEGKTLTPICDATHQCVLYVGQDQNDFSKPKLFSSPFFVTGGKADTQP